MRIAKTLYLIAAAISIFAAPANADVDDQQQSFYHVGEMIVALNNCPRFKVIPSEFRKELRAAGVQKWDQDFERVRAEVALKNDPEHGGYDTLTMVNADYQVNPSRWCDAIWHRYGPQGTYIRQLVE